MAKAEMTASERRRVRLPRDRWPAPWYMQVAASLLLVPVVVVGYLATTHPAVRGVWLAYAIFLSGNVTRGLTRERVEPRSEWIKRLRSGYEVLQ